MNGRKMILIVGMLLLAACGPDPRKEAKAQETILLAEQTAANMEQTRQIEREQANAAQLKSEYWQAVWTTNTATVQSGMRLLSWVVFVALCVIVLGFAWTIKETAIGLGRTFVSFTEVRAGLIHMDKATRTFPGLVDVRQVHGTRVVGMLSTGGVIRLDVSKPADRQLIAALAQVSALGAAYQEMATSKDPGGMAIMQPDVIGASDGPLMVGAEFIKTLEGAQR